MFIPSTISFATRSLCTVYLYTYLLSGIPNRSTIDLVYNVACPMPIMLENSLMLALCLMLSSPNYAKLCWHNWLKAIPQWSPALDLKLREQFRVDSGSDDPDYLGHLGHFFGESSRSYHKLNYLDVNWTFNRSHVLWKKTLASDKWVNLGPGGCTEPSLVWNLLTTLSCFEACGVQRFHSQEFCAWYQFCILKVSMVLFHIWFFHVILHNFYKENFSMWVTRGSYVGHIQIAQYVG